MAGSDELSKQRRWGHFRYGVLGPLLSAPPRRSELTKELTKLAAKTWKHPITCEDVQFGFSTIEGWYYKVRAEKRDPITPLTKKERKDKGVQHVITEEIADILRAQYADYFWWDIQLHTKNLAAEIKKRKLSVKAPSISSVRRFMRAAGLKRLPRPRQDLQGMLGPIPATEEHEIACFEMSHPNQLWSLDFHDGAIMVLDSDGKWRQPVAVALLDHYSRMICHAEWVFTESAENLVRATSIAIMKHGRPHCLLSDNGGAMRAGEYIQGLGRLGIRINKIKPRKPNQNGKTEAHWGSLESKLLAMLIGHEGLTIDQLNDLTLAWVEAGYNRSIHREIKMTPLERYLQGTNVGLTSCDEDTLKRAFRSDEFRRPRKSDGTIKIADILFRLPQKFWHLNRVLVRYARWDLSFVHVVDYASGNEIMRIYPVDKLQNADSKRRSIESPVQISPDLTRTVLPSYLQELIQQYEQLTNKPMWVKPTIIE